MEKQSVPMQQYPQSPDPTGTPQPPVYAQDPNAQYHQQYQQQYPQPYPQQPQSPQPYPQQPQSPQPYPQQPQSPPPTHPQSYEHQQKAYPGAEPGMPPQHGMSQQPGMPPQQPGMPPQQPGMPPQQPSGPVYQNATPVASLGRGPAPADCPACGQRSMTSVVFETGNTTNAWALGLCCLCCLGCIPYVMNSLKDVSHKCGTCGVLLATWHRSGATEVHVHS